MQSNKSERPYFQVAWKEIYAQIICAIEKDNSLTELGEKIEVLNKQISADMEIDEALSLKIIEIVDRSGK